jgi:hypothetical protein
VRTIRSNGGRIPGGQRLGDRGLDDVPGLHVRDLASLEHGLLRRGAAQRGHADQREDDQRGDPGEGELADRHGTRHLPLRPPGSTGTRHRPPRAPGSTGTGQSHAVPAAR